MVIPIKRFANTLKFDAVRLDSQHRSAYSSFDIGIASCLAADMFEGASNVVPLNHSWLTSLEVSHFALLNILDDKKVGMDTRNRTGL